MNSVGEMQSGAAGSANHRIATFTGRHPGAFGSRASDTGFALDVRSRYRRPECAQLEGAIVRDDAVATGHRLDDVLGAARKAVLGQRFAQPQPNDVNRCCTTGRWLVVPQRRARVLLGYDFVDARQ